jgi:2-keto-4-pentenoate hydratase/2-oxohepta-3-ene-1,7-dioic acid hydratase in catechol pathway
MRIAILGGGGAMGGLFGRPPVFMKEGDVVEIEAEGIAVLRNTIVASART